MYTVYKHTSPDGKVYIGITGQKPKRRWQNGNGYKQNKHLYNAIRKYTWKNFKHDILETGLTKEQACDLEIELIAKYDATNPKHGYNHAIGGEVNIPSKETRRKLSESHKGIHPSAETRQKLSELNKGKHLSAEHRRKIGESNKRAYLNPELRQKLSELNKDKHLSVETRRKIGESGRGRTPWNKGAHLSYETRRKLSESHKGANHQNYGKHLSAETRRKIGESNAKAVICIETGTLYSSGREAAESIGVTPMAISNVLRGVQKTSGGYHWKYANGGEHEE